MVHLVYPYPPVDLFRISHFRILQKLGSGGSAEVYLAEDTNLFRKVALKLLHPRLTVEPEKVERFRQEAQWASLLNHPNVITIYEVGEADGTHFIATEYVEGETLRKHVSRGMMSLAQALDVGIGIGSALVAAHEAWIVHRDLKPENVMLRPDGYVKVLDFGVAKLTQGVISLRGVKTEPRMLLGTVEYMAPEQLRAEGVDPRTDLFSLGVVLHEMISGTGPFSRPSWPESVTAILNEEPPPMVHSKERIPEELHRIVTKALKKEMGERYQSSREIVDELRELLGTLEFEKRLASQWTKEKG
ncbi:MAG TPA: serine/threonine-protein kinase [Thermoanaerobaculia bacterium]|nr:serine/threonine-protein kinase [Thermoanaerobaculia bacterium]